VSSSHAAVRADDNHGACPGDGGTPCMNCRTLAKKQQASKKSLGLGPRMNAQSLMDEYSNNVSWNFDLDPEGILLPAGDIKNFLDFRKFSWPVLAANNDCNFDFDIPFTADGLDTANFENPVSTLKNNCPSYLNQLSQPIDLTKPPRDLVKILDLNDKVRPFG